MRRLTLNEIQEFWGYSITGIPKKVRPQGYETSSGENLTAANVTLCAVWVQSVPMYQSHGEALKRLLRGTEDFDDVVKWAEFWKSAEHLLTEMPVFAAYLPDTAAKTPITYLTPKEVSKRLKRNVGAIRQMIREKENELTLSFTDDRGCWRIHPDDLKVFQDRRKKDKTPAIAEAVEAVSEVS